MVLIRLLLILLLAASASPAGAHKDHQKKMAEAAEAAQAAQATKMSGAKIGAPKAVVVHPMSPEVHEAIKEDIAALEAEAAKPIPARLIDWLGRTHPFSVHFPLAMFPIAWIALLLARRRGDTVDLIRSLIVVAGASAVGAAVLGWFNAGFNMADSDRLLLWHRWLGTGFGVTGGLIAFAAWRWASAVNSRAMVWTLGLVTIGLLVQGWLGGALIHGVDRLNW